MGLRVGGLASGLDTAALIEALLTLERRPLQLVEQRKAQVEAQQTLHQELGTKVAALRDAASAIDNLSPTLATAAFNEEFFAFTAIPSDETVLTADASSASVPGTTEIIVNELAQVARQISTPFASDTAIIAAEGETIDIIHGGGENPPALPISITIGAGGKNIRDLAGLINDDPNNGGSVRADVIFSGSAFHLIVSGTNPGVANDVTLTTSIQGEGGGAFLDTDPLVSTPASDAQLTVFGLPVTRSSNSITDIVPGVSLQLLAKSEGQTITVQVSRNDEEIQEKLQAFVDAYNEIADFVATNGSLGAEGEEGGALAGDSAIRGIEQQIQSSIRGLYDFSPNPLRVLDQIGISFGTDSRLTLDSAVLKTELATDASAVRELLTGNGATDGAIAAVSRSLDVILDPDPDKGILAGRAKALDDRIRGVRGFGGLDDQIARLEDRLEQREQLLVQRFTQLETALAQLQNQGSALDSFSILRPNP